MNRRRWALLCLGLIALLLLPGSAQAANHTVTLTSNGPSPASITIARGDSITFSNTDSVSHTITHTSGAWSYSATIPAGRTATTPAFSSAGTFGYDDSFAFALFVQHAHGSITVTAPKPRPTTPPPTASPRPTATRSPTPSPSSSPVPLSPAIVDTLPPPSPTAGPTPSIAPPPVITYSPTPGQVSVAYGSQRSLVQSSPQRYGLPALLALVGALGVLSLIVRLLLSQRW